MIESLADHVVTSSIGRRDITHLRFVSDINGLASHEQELTEFVTHIDKPRSTFGMESVQNKQN